MRATSATWKNPHRVTGHRQTFLRSFYSDRQTTGVVRDHDGQMRKPLAAIGVTAAILGGGAAGLALTLPGDASAGTSVQIATADPTTDTTVTGTSRPDRSARMTEVLKGLVDKGVITQAQADAIVAAFEAARPTDAGSGFPGRGLGAGFGADLDAAATAIGIDRSALVEALRAGSKSIADIAGDHNVTAQTVIDAVVKAQTAKLAAAVSSGKITQAQSDERSKNLTQRVTDAVNAKVPTGGPAFPGRRGRGHGPAPASATTSTTTG